MTLNSIGNAQRKVFLPIVLFVMTALLIVFAVISLSSLNKNYIETQATIDDIKETIIGEETSYEVYVNYTVGDVKYNHIQINTYDNSYKVGKTITILYDPNNPSTIVGKPSIVLTIIAFVAAGLCFAGGCYLVFRLISSSKKKKMLTKTPIITSDNRVVGANKNMYFCTDFSNPIKLRFYIEDDNRKTLYEGKMTKQNFVGAHTYVFKDCLKQKETEHKVGHVNETSNETFTISRGFTFDDVEITEFFEANNVHVDYGISGDGISIDIQHKGNHIASAVTSSKYVHNEDAQNHSLASKFRFNQYFYQIEGQESYIDVIFLVLFKEALSPRAGTLL